MTLWGSGTPLREFLHTRDLAKAVDVAVEKYDESLHLNVGSGQEISIKNLAELIAKISGYEGEIMWDRTKPDGTPRKVMDVSRLKNLGWEQEVSLEEGIAETVLWFEANYK